MSLIRALLVGLVLFGAATSVRAVDGIALELGVSDSSNASVDIARIGVQWNWSKRWALSPSWHVGGYWDLSLGYWDNNSSRRTHSSLTDLGFTPVFRLEQTNPGAFAPYLEAAIGFHLLSHTSVSTERQFSTSFQFGEHVGIGMRFGPRRAYDLGYRFQHLSNAGIKQPNQGINFHLLHLQYHF